MPRSRLPSMILGLLVALAACMPDIPVEGPELLPGPPPIEYPLDLWDQGMEGQAMLMLHVTEEGAVDSVYLESSSGFPDFDSAAVAGGRRMRFTPAKRGEERVDAWTRVPVQFQRGSPQESDPATRPGGAG